MKQKLCVITAVLCTIISMALTGLSVLFLFDYYGTEYQNTMVIGLVVFGGTALLDLGIVSTMNRIYDRLQQDVVVKKIVLNRWTMSALMADFLTGLAAAAFWTLGPGYQNQFDENTLWMSRVLMALVGLMVFGQYRANYRKYLAARNERIRTLTRENVMNHGRRFVLAALNVTSDGRYMILHGRLTGKIRKGDQVLIHYSGAEEHASTVRWIEVKGKRVWQAADGETAVCINVRTGNADKYFVRNFCVLTDIRTMHRAEDVIQAENPGLTGMISIYDAAHSDKHYMSLLMYELCHARYLLTAVPAEGETQEGDIMDALRSNTNVRFPAVFMNGKKEDQLLAVFTDWDALRRWTTAMKEPRSCTLLSELPQVINISRKSLHGAVINPFGPRSFYLSAELMESIRQLDGYKEQFLKEKR